MRFIRMLLIVPGRIDCELLYTSLTKYTPVVEFFSGAARPLIASGFGRGLIGIGAKHEMFGSRYIISLPTSVSIRYIEYALSFWLLP